MDEEVHPYFAYRAREIFERVGGDPDKARYLAAWAQRVRGRADVHGAIVSRDGVVVAETIHVPATDSSPGVTYVRPDDAWAFDLFGNEVGLALGQIRRKLGVDVIHVERSEVCFGPGPDRSTEE